MTRGRKPTLAGWIESRIVLPEAICADHGPMKIWPWMRDVVGAIGDASIPRVTLIKSVRCGFSTTLWACIGYYVAEDPGPILVVVPAQADARRALVSEIEPIFAASPRLKNLLPEPNKSGSNRSTILHRLFKGGSLHFVPARAPRNLRGPTARILLVDECDAMLITPEGNPLDLAVDRTFSFADRKIICGSTPGDASSSLIKPLYDQSDARVFEVPCPSCDELNEITWKDIQWPEGRPQDAHYVCPSCGSVVEEKHKRRMVTAGRWRITAPEVQGHAGFRLNSLVSLLENASWGKLAADFVAKENDPARLRTFVNRFLGETWEDRVDVLDHSALASRVQPFSLDAIPAAVIFLTSGTDVQHDRLETTVVGWTRDGEMYVLGHFVHWGSPDENDCWLELDALLKTEWPHPHGGKIRIDAGCVDSGDGQSCDQVYKFCFPRTARRIMASKSMSGSRPSIQISKSWIKGGRIWIIGHDPVKSAVMSRLARGTTIKFSDSLEPVWFEQLASEKQVTRWRGGRRVTRFEPISGRRNEALDCLVMAYAARQALTIPNETRETQLKSIVQERRSSVAERLAELNKL